ncbi:MAG TPA: glycoside hydrolase family 38 C-terminal domain-containing protein, partial [Candidatus Lokiarchaeia archaeon]|nr:glycoside hydrolase family 38 C-terminal domain-containing protein [Candidatus Lokiarchaeia archaeon]
RQGFAHWSTVKDFFDEVAQWQDRLPIWRDEQYLEYHRGTFTVHAEVKRHNRLYENALLSADNLSSILSALAPDYIRPSALLEDMWKVLLCNQFHDVLPGSSIPEVYDDINDDWDAFDAALPWIYGEAEEVIPVPAGATLLLYNPAPVQRKGPVFIPLDLLPELASEGDALKFISLISLGVKPGAYLGQPVETEPEWWVARRGAGWWAVVDLEPMSVTPYTVTLAEGDLPDAISAVVGEAPFIDNGIVRVDLDSNTGAITKLASQLVPDVETVLQGTDNNLTVAYLDDYPNDHAWNIKPEYWKYPIEMRNDEDMEITLVAQGPVFTTLEVTRTLGEAKSKVWQRVTLMAGCPEVFLEWIADWQETYRMLKVVYDTATNAEKCTADAAYHAIERATPPIDAPSPPLAQWARYEKIMHKYCDVSTSDNAWGVAILNEGKYAFDAVGGRMRLTMLRVPVYTTPAGEAWVIKERAEREAAGKGTVPQFSGIGPFRCRYALLPHAGGALQHADGTPNPLVKNHADAFNAPIVPIQVVPSNNDGNTDENIADGQAWVTATPANASVTVIKPNEWDGNGNLILRVVEICGVDVPEAVQLQLHPVLAAKVRDARAVDILERPLADNPVQWDAANGQITFPLKHFEICTIELVL